MIGGPGGQVPAPAGCHANRGNPMTDICFLTYLNRSGSTLLAEKLDRLPNICVSLEPDIRDGVGTAEELFLRNAEALNGYLDEIYLSHKFSKWGVKRDALHARLLQQGFPLSFREILPAILDLYCGPEQTDLHVFKSNDYFRHHERLREMFPGSKFIFVARDPRGIYNSEKQAVDSRGKPMRRNIALFAAHYVRTHNFIKEHLHGRDYFHYVRYEDLVSDETLVMQDLEIFLGIPCRVSGSGGDYFEKIPDNQKHLHRNLADGKMKPKRISAWESELEPAEISFLQTVLRNYLEMDNYPSMSVPPLSPAGRLALAQARLRFLAGFTAPHRLKRSLPLFR
jgi:hypothetical protein